MLALAAHPAGLQTSGGVSMQAAIEEEEASPVPSGRVPDLERASTGPSATPLSPQSSGASPEPYLPHRHQRASRPWHTGARPPSARASLDLQEPFLSGELSEQGVRTPDVPTKAEADASGVLYGAAAALAHGGGGGPRGAAAAAAAAAAGDPPPTDITKALVFGMINSIATIPALVAYAAIVFKVRRACTARSQHLTPARTPTAPAAPCRACPALHTSVACVLMRPSAPVPFLPFYPARCAGPHLLPLPGPALQVFLPFLSGAPGRLLPAQRPALLRRVQAA